MRLEKKVVKSGDGTRFPNAGDLVTVDYVLWLHAPGQPDGKGRESVVDSSRTRGPFTTEIGTDQVIQGWDILVLQMSLGEKSLLFVPSHMAYGSKGFPGAVPPDTDLVFEVELKRVTTQDRGAVSTASAL